MKICFITSSIFDLGGVQRVVSVLASALSEMHDVTVLCTSDEYKINREIYDLSTKVKVDLKGGLLKKRFTSKVLCKVGRFLNDKTMLLNKHERANILTSIYYPREVQEKFIDYLNSEGYDVVIGVEGYYSLLVGCISNRLSAKTIGWQHNSYDAYLKNPNRYYWKQDELFNLLIPKLNKYFVLTEYDKEMYLKQNNIQCDVMYNPRSFESKEKSMVNDKMFLAAGRFTHQKGFDLLIESFAEFCRDNDEWSLVIVGEGEEKEELQTQISNYGLDRRVEIHGFSDNIKEYFLQSSALLLSSRWEGMPMIVLEAMEMGVPTIAYSITAAEQLIEDGSEGILVDRFDTKSFANAMIKVANSRDLRLQMSKRAIEKSKEFSVDTIVSKWYEILNSLE